MQSRKDDLESLLYVLIYCLIGRLPWQNIKKMKEQSELRRIEAIGEYKMSIPTDELCKNIPDEFKIMLNYVKSLTFY